MRRIAGWAIWFVVALCAIWAVVRLLGLETGYPLVPLIAYTPFVALATLPLLTAAFLLRQWLAAGACVAVAVTLAAVVLPRAFAGGQGPDERPAGPALTVLSANLKFGSADSEAVVELVREGGVDVLSLQELTPRAVRGLRAAGLDDMLSERALAPQPRAAGGGIYSRYPLAGSDTGVVGSGGFSMPIAEVEVPGAGVVELMSVHPPPPTNSTQVGRWRSDLEFLPEADPGGAIRLLAGDFNATLDHAELRDLVGSGYVDAADVAGAGLAFTWPSGRIPPPVTIDHVLADERIWVDDASVHEIPGSDHRAVLADLVLPATPVEHP